METKNYNVGDGTMEKLFPLCLQCTKCKRSFIFNKEMPCPDCSNTEFIDSPDAKWLPVNNGGEEIEKARGVLETFID